jgi:Holliday junction resolvasome RuvABC endonuclease subunit
MIRVLLPQARPADEHAADALAVAVTLAHAGDLGGRLAQALEVGK